MTRDPVRWVGLTKHLSGPLVLQNGDYITGCTIYLPRGAYIDGRYAEEGKATFDNNTIMADNEE